MTVAALVMTAGALALLGWGAQLLATELGRHPTDVRRPGPLVHVGRSKPSRVHNPELRRLSSVISYAIADDRTAKRELQQIFNDLDATVSPLVGPADDRRNQRRRSQQIEDAIVALEQRLPDGDERQSG